MVNCQESTVSFQKRDTFTAPPRLTTNPVSSKGIANESKSEFNRIVLATILTFPVTITSPDIVPPELLYLPLATAKAALAYIAAELEVTKAALACTNEAFEYAYGAAAVVCIVESGNTKLPPDDSVTLSALIY